MPLSLVTSRSPKGRRVDVAVAVLLLATSLTACGEDSEAPAASEPTSQSVESETSSPSKSPSESESPSEPPSKSPSKSPSEDAGPTLEVEVEGDEVKPVAEQIDLAVGQRLTITVQSNRAGELHVHSDPEHTFEFGAGTETFRLTVDTPGSVDIEEHESDALVARLLVR
jgi:type IV secretory pathway VirB10-like protein